MSPIPLKLTLLRTILLKPRKPRRKLGRKNSRIDQTIKIAPRLNAIIATRRTIMQNIIPSQKTSYNLAISNSQLRRKS